MRKILVTAALPYANGELHLGHLKSTYLPPDIFVKYCRLKGYDVVYVCGSDQHGTPIEINARKSGMSIEEYIEYWRRRHIEDFRLVGVEFDIFYKTHSPENIKLTQEFLTRLRENGYLYEKEVVQLYCPHDRLYLADRFVRGKCPYCGAEDQYGDHCEVCGSTYEPWELVEPRCAICGSRDLERRTSKHYYFKLSALAERLREWITSRGFQKSVVRYLLNWLERLRDWDITRENYWGIPMPFEDAKDKYVYVWFDAPIGYISATVKWASERGRRWEEFWKEEGAEIIHFIGKDIIYHHFLFWPAMLMAVGGYNLPTNIVVRGFLTLEGRKFSKSRKWYLSIRKAAEIFDPDYLRFYLTLVTPASLEDTDFALEDFKNIVNSGLCDTIGNYVHRVTSLLHRLYGGVVPDPGQVAEGDRELLEALRALPGRVGEALESFDPKTGLERVLEFARLGNRHLNQREPWKKFKVERGEADSTMFVASNSVAGLAVVLYPFTPRIAKRIWRILDVGRELEDVRWDEAGEPMLRPGHRIGKPEIVAPKVTDEQVERARGSFGL